MGLYFAIVCIYLLGGISASLLYHRILTHKAVKLQGWFEKLLVIIALPAGTPVQWVGTHRQHHYFTDKPGDPHSPVVDGFWYAHCGWYIKSHNFLVCFFYAISGSFRMFFDAWWRPRNRLEYNHLAEDISQVKFYNWISRPVNYTLILTIYASLLQSIFFAIWDLKGTLALWAIMFVVYNLGDSLNSLGHHWLIKPSHANSARNNLPLSLLTFGEGFHANHHQVPGNLIPNSIQKISLSAFILYVWKKVGLIKTENKTIKTLSSLTKL